MGKQLSWVQSVYLCLWGILGSIGLFGVQPTLGQGQSLVLNELMADNQATLADEAGEYEDWVELHNTGNTPIDIGGFYISDDLANPFTWRIPQYDPQATTISAGGYLVLWLDGQPYQGIRHTNFKLGQKGETVGLFDRNGQQIDSVKFGALDSDTTWGRLPNGSGNWTLLSSPSPERPNIPAPEPATVVINEIMASNASTIADMVDFDDYTDWIELYNDHSESVDLSGYYLTDDLDDPVKWEIPAGTTIAPYGYLIIWADGYDSGIGYTYPRGYWPWESFITRNLHTNFKLSSLGEELGLFRGEPGLVVTFVEKQTEWKYQDAGQDLGTDWIAPDYNDLAWSSGNAQLGYGDNDEATTISFGENPNDKHRTTYFRKFFHIDTLPSLDFLTLNILRDDGAVVYLNGTEVARSNMPTDDVHYETKAEDAVSGGDEDAFFTFTMSTNPLLQGNNLIAVEIHQISPTSSDVSFDLELIGEKQKPTYRTQVKPVDSITFGHQLTDVSYGRNPTDNSWCYFGEPTPATANITESIINPEHSGDIVFSMASGFYADTQVVSLQSTDPEAAIFYTTDSSMPTSASTRYTTPISINETTIIRARAKTAGKLPGAISTQTYFINELTPSLPIAAIAADETSLWDETIGLYENVFKGKEIPIVLEYFTPDGHSVFNTPAGLRIGGYNIWRYAQKPLNVYFRDRYGVDTINYPFFESKAIGTFKSITFRNGGDSWPKTLLNDAMSESIAEGQLACSVQSYRPCIVFLNGVYWGIHPLRERLDSNYFASNYNQDVSNIEHIRYNNLPPSGSLGLEVIQGSVDGYNAFIAFVEDNDLAQDEYYNAVAEQMSIYSFIDSMATYIYACNTSWKHNREWWRSLGEQGKWTWFISDLDRGYDITKVSRNILDDIVGGYSLFSNLLESPHFLNKFIQRFAAHLNSTFAAERMYGIIDRLGKTIEPEMPRHIDRWENEGGISSLVSWDEDLNEMKNFAIQRPEHVFSQLAGEFDLPETAELTVRVNEPNSGTILICDVPMSVRLEHLTFFQDIPIELKTVPHPGFEFVGWESVSDSNSITLTLDGDRTITALFRASNEILIPSTITTNTQLLRTDVPYTTLGDITVEANAYLSIGKGVRIAMPPGASLYVKGVLNMAGTELEPIQIYPRRAHADKPWGAICFDNAVGQNIISHAIISGATHGEDPLTQKAAISSYDTHLILDNLTLNNVNFPIFLQYGTVTLSNSTIYTEVTCDYINVKYGEATILNNTFLGNQAPDTDAIDLDGTLNASVLGNRIYNFQGVNCDAIDIGEQSQALLIEGNIIYNSSDKGISIGQESDATILNNVITDCRMGIALKDTSFAEIDKNTLVSNDISIACFEKNYGKGGGHAVISNTLFSSAITHDVFVDHTSQASTSYCLSDMTALPGAGNLYGDPEFIDLFNYNLQIASTSLCIDTGSPTSDKDPDGSRTDIGAHYEYRKTDFPAEIRKVKTVSVVINEIMYNDTLEIGSSDWIELYNPTGQTIDLSAWTITDSNELRFYAIPAGTLLLPGDFLVLCRNMARFSAAYPDITNCMGDLGFGLGNEDKIMLFDSNDHLVTHVFYANTTPWPASPDGHGQSLELTNPLDLNYRTINWRASINGPTPGKPNSLYAGEN
ncbi:lamin tail domain-containing protein [Planctomycetota bacterium]